MQVYMIFLTGTHSELATLYHCFILVYAVGKNNNSAISYFEETNHETNLFINICFQL